MQRPEEMNEKSWIRGRIRVIVSSLHRLDDELAGLAESLVLPLDADEMWNSRLPATFSTNLFSAIDAVRTDGIQDAMEILLQAVRESDVSLRRKFECGSEPIGRSFFEES